MAKQKVEIRAYDVGFGDCVLVRFPLKDRTGHMLVDFGRAPGKGGTTKVFPAIAADIEELCDGRLDVLVMSHEHLDHMEGFYHQRAVFDRMRIDHVWMSLPSHPTYYDDYPDAEPLKKLRAMAEAFSSQATRSGLALAPSFEALLENNLSNVDRVDYLRKRVRRVQYLARNKNADDTAPFPPGTVKILAPEADASGYYGRATRRAVSAFARGVMGAADDHADPADPWTFPEVEKVAAPENLTPADWRQLREGIQGGAEAVRLIDRAANNTSLCFTLEVAGKRLLFPGDAELESWEVMARKGVLEGPFDFVKLSHHGSHNGTPLDHLDDLLPRRRKGKAVVLVSTKSDVYGIQNPVPDEELLTELRKRARVYSTENAGPNGWVDIVL